MFTVYVYKIITQSQITVHNRLAIGTLGWAPKKESKS